jgi:hypothetical protein
MDKFELTRERINEEKARICFYRIGNLVHKDTGIPKQLHELDEDTEAAIQGFEIERRMEGDTVVIKTKVKMPPKAPVLDQVSKQLGMYDQDNRQKSGTMDELLDAVDGATRGLPSDHPDDED